MAAGKSPYDLDPNPGEPAPLRVCVVNDDSAVRVSLKFVLQAAGFEVRAYASGRGLLASPSLRVAHGFVLDHKPRGVDGLDLARRLRALGLNAPIVLTTGLRSGALENILAAVEPVIPAPRVDEEIIARFVRMIEGKSDLRNTT